MTPIQASKKSNEKLVFDNLENERQKQKPKFHQVQLLRTPDIRSVFSKGDSTNYGYKIYTITEVIHDTFPSYRIDYLPERHNQNLLLPTKLSLDEKKSSYEETKFNSIMKNLINEINRRQNI